MALIFFVSLSYTNNCNGLFVLLRNELYASSVGKHMLQSFIIQWPAFSVYCCVLKPNFEPRPLISLEMS